MSSLRDTVSCFHLKVKIEKVKSGRKKRILEAPEHMGVYESASLNLSRQVREGAVGEPPALNAAEDHRAAWVTPGVFGGSSGITHKSSPSHLLLILLSCCVSWIPTLAWV